MNGHELHNRGLVDDRGAIVAALIGDGWDQAEAEALLIKYVADAKAIEPARNWQRWTPDELALVDQAIDEAGGQYPGAAAIRQLAERLGRKDKSVLGACERRLAARSNGSTS